MMQQIKISELLNICPIVMENCFHSVTLFAVAWITPKVWPKYIAKRKKCKKEFSPHASADENIRVYKYLPNGQNENSSHFMTLFAKEGFCRRRRRRRWRRLLFYTAREGIEGRRGVKKKGVANLSSRSGLVILPLSEKIDLPPLPQLFHRLDPSFREE